MKGKIQSWSSRTKGIKIDGVWYDTTEFVVERAEQLGQGAEVDFEITEGPKKSIEFIKGQSAHEFASKRPLSGSTNYNIVQVRESALKSAVSNSITMDLNDVKEVLEKAKMFEKYLLSGGAGGD